MPTILSAFVGMAARSLTEWVNIIVFSVILWEELQQSASSSS